MLFNPVHCSLSHYYDKVEKSYNKAVTVYARLSFFFPPKNKVPASNDYFLPKITAFPLGEENAYPYFPNSETVVPPTGTAFPGPYTSHIVRATWAFLGRSGYFTGSFSHSFQL